jgi:hypothetical protein
MGGSWLSMLLLLMGPTRFMGLTRLTRLMGLIGL